MATPSPKPQRDASPDKRQTPGRIADGDNTHELDDGWAGGVADGDALTKTPVCVRRLTSDNTRELDYRIPRGHFAHGDVPEERART